LKPAFRDLDYLPVRARIFNLPLEKTPLAVLYQTIEQEARANHMPLPPNWQCETLWESFFNLRPTEENGLKPIVLILDQFEELFTLMACRPQEQEDFVAQFADLSRGRMPETVREKYRAELAALPAASDEARQLEQLFYGTATPAVRILLSLREDYLAFLNNLGRRIPKVFASRYRLSSLSIEQARAAIANPPQQNVLGEQKFRLEADAIAALLKFLTVQSSVSGVSEEVIGPPQLQVLCRQLEEQMRQRGQNRISEADLGGDAGMRKLLSRYYRGILGKFPALRIGSGPKRLSGLLGILQRLLPLHSPRFAVRRLCEERLITAGGNRNSRHEDEIIHEIGVAPDDLQELVESRLLRREPRLQESFYELSHDSLVPSLQVAGGLRQTWLMGLKMAAIAAAIFIVAYWGLPYLRGVYEMRSLESEFAAVKNGEVEVDYFRTRLKQARSLMKDSNRLEEIENEFDDWRIESLRSAFLNADLPLAEARLKILEEEYPREKFLLAALADTLRERKIRQIEQRYRRILEFAEETKEKYKLAGALLDSAYTAFQGNTRIVELQTDLAIRRGDAETLQQLARELEVKKESAGKELFGAIQLKEPSNTVVKGDSSGKASGLEIVLQYNPILAGAVVLLNGKEMAGESSEIEAASKLKLSSRQKEMPLRPGKFRYGTVTIPAGAREISARITARKEEAEASRDFTFAVDREPPRIQSYKILYKDAEKEEWQTMPANEWRGGFLRIEVRASEPLQEAALNIRPRYANPELSQIDSDNLQGMLANAGREAIFSLIASEKFKTVNEVECTLRLQDVAGWQSTINLGKWKVAKTETDQAPLESKPAIQLPVRLRSTPDENLTADEVRSMIKKFDFFCLEYDWTKAWSNPNGKGIANEFVAQQNGQVILDRATGLMWQQSGPSNFVRFDEAQKYVTELNRQKFAGFSDWRLPTLEEAMSLMESKSYGGCYFNPIFDCNRRLIWTADKFSAGSAWYVNFFIGFCSNHGISNNNSVRAVRSGQ
jgi:hypothetical protein